MYFCEYFSGIELTALSFVDAYFEKL